MARIFVVTSGKGGVGKSTVCANLGKNLAANGLKTLLVDADMGLENLDVLLGLEGESNFTLFDVINSRCRLAQALVQDKRFNNLFLLPAGQAERSNITRESFLDVIEEAANHFDYILIDSPAGLEEGFHRAALPASEAIVVVAPTTVSVRDASKVMASLWLYNLNSVGLVINRVRGDMLLSGEILSVEKISTMLSAPVFGVIPEDDAIFTLSTLGAFAYDSPGAKAFNLLYENVHSGSKKIYDCRNFYKGFFGQIKRNLKRKI